MSDIVATWMRGGTSKCWVFERDQLDIENRTVEEVLLRLFGSPDPRQIDGIGGATSTTSKAVIVSPSREADADVDYTFAQVGIEQEILDWGSNCGNCSSVVGPYAVGRGWVRAQHDVTDVRVRNTNTGQLMVLQVPTPDGRFDENGSERIPGVPFPGTSVRMWFVDPAGRTTGRAFPTGNTIDYLAHEDRVVPMSIVDAGAPLIIVPAKEVGLVGNETPTEIDQRPDLLRQLDDLRRKAAVAMGLATTTQAAQRAVPKLALVAEPTGAGADLVVRMLSMGRVHPAVAITGSVGLTLAARTPGTVLDLLIGTVTVEKLRLQTPVGVVTTWSGSHDGQLAVAVTRTARTIARARLPLPSAALASRAFRGHDEHTVLTKAAG